MLEALLLVWGAPCCCTCVDLACCGRFGFGLCIRLSACLFVNCVCWRVVGSLIYLFTISLRVGGQAVLLVCFVCLLFLIACCRVGCAYFLLWFLAAVLFCLL